MRALQDLLLLVCRFLLCALFIVAGWGKIFTMSGFAAGMAAKGLPYPDLFPIAAIVIELGGGVVLALGIETRLLAVLFAIYTMVASLISHPYWTMDDPATRATNLINFYKNLAIIGGFLLLSLNGGGRLSVDGLFDRRGHRPWRPGAAPSKTVAAPPTT